MTTAGLGYVTWWGYSPALDLINLTGMGCSLFCWKPLCFYLGFDNEVKFKTECHFKQGIQYINLAIMYLTYNIMSSMYDLHTHQCLGIRQTLQNSIGYYVHLFCIILMRPGLADLLYHTYTCFIALIFLLNCLLRQS